MLRRDLIVGALLAGALPYSRARSDTGFTFEELGVDETQVSTWKALDEFIHRSEPVAQLIEPVVSLYEIYRNNQLQGEIISHLDKIQRQLAIVNTKLDSIISLLRGMPNMIRRELEKNSRNNLIVSIGARHQRLIAMLNGVQSPQNLPSRERDILRSEVYESLIQEVSELRGLGQIGFADVAYGFSVVFIAAKWCGIRKSDFEESRKQVVEYFNECSALFNTQYVADAGAVAYAKQTSNDHHGFVLLSDVAVGVNGKKVVARIKGSYGRGFSILPENPNGTEMSFQSVDFPVYISPFVDSKSNVNVRTKKIMPLVRRLSVIEKAGLEAEPRVPTLLHSTDATHLLGKIIAQIEY